MSVDSGEIFGFIGPNGAGKSTTLRILMGLIKKSSGQVQVMGKDPWKDALEIHKRVSYVPGDVSLWPNLTGGEVIDLLANLRGEFDPDYRDELIEIFKLDPTQKCSTYSTGNRQKVALIAALASEVELYILDEPTSGMDPLMEELFREKVRELKKQQKTVFLSSHILAEVEALCDRVGIIKEGHLIETGTFEQLRHLTRTSITVDTFQPLTGLENFKGVYNITFKDSKAQFSVDAEKIDALLQYLIPFGVKSIISTPPTLEELFIRYYAEES